MNSSNKIIATVSKAATEKVTHKTSEMPHATQDEILEWAPLLPSSGEASEPGIAAPLTAALIIGDAHWTGTIANGEAVARILPDGRANLGSTKTMMSLGFYAAECFTHPVTLRNPQKITCGSAEIDGVELKYLMQRGDAAEIETRSIAALAGWAVRFGKSLGE